MTERVQQIIQHIVLDNEESVSRALDQTNTLTDLSIEEKNEIAVALSTVFYHHDHTGITGMTKIALKTEKQIAKFGGEVVPFLIEELINADSESAAYLGRAIALNDSSAIDVILEAWEENWDDDFATINIIQALAYSRSEEVKKAIPQILVAAKSANFQVRSIALYAIGKIARRISSDAFSDKLRASMFDIAFESLSDRKPLVRKNAARTLGKMQKKGLLVPLHERKIHDAFKAILGKDDRHQWDRAFIVRHEAEHFLPFFKIEKTHADKYRQSFRIVSKRELADKTFIIEIEARLIARKMQAGQFIIVRPFGTSERVPLSICAWDRQKGTVQIIVMSVGKTSTQINLMNVGDTFVDIVGPLGERSLVKKHDGTCIVIGGGYGTGAILPTARDLKGLGNNVIGIVGARTSNALLMMNEMRQECDEVIATTDDGSEGKKGFVTDALREVMKREKVSHVLAVGPVPMMKAVSDMTRTAGIETYVSLNAIMVDGTGMCGACRVSVGGKTRFACFHGPDFDAHLVDFEQLMKRQKMFSKQEQDAFEALEA